MSEIIPNTKIENQKDKIQNPIEANCIQKDTVKWLCELKTWVFETSQEKTNEQIKELLQTQNYLAEKVSAENENQVLLVIKSPTGKYHLITIPRSFWEQQKLAINIEWKNISLEAVPKTNGYNTEYKINDGNGERKQIAILFTMINPEWKAQKQKIAELENIRKELIEQNKKLQKDEKTLQLKIKKEEKEKKKDFKKHIQTYKNEIQKSKDKVVNNWVKVQTLNSIIWWKNRDLSKIKKLIDFPYTPYNRSYDTQEMRNSGFSYIDAGTKNAFSHLWNEKSVVGKEKKLTIREAFSHDIATTLNIVERMDFYSYFQRDGKTLKDKKTLDDLMNKQISKALTTIALNQKWAFNWQRSQVWALWIGQFMPSTYSNLLDRYKKIFPENMPFEDGAKDHDTSFRLQALHFHEESRAFPKWIKDNWQSLVNDKEARIGLHALIAAGYNGSITRIIKEAQLWETFDKSLLHPDNLIERLGKNKETQTYVMKFVFTWNYLEKTYREFWK